MCAAFDLQPRGSAGEHSPAKGAKFDVSNKQRLGFSEVQLVQKMIDGVSKVIELEEMLAGGASAADVRAKVNEMKAAPAAGSGAAAVLGADAHDVLAVLFALRRADAGDAAEGRDGRGLGVDDGVDRLIIKHAEGRLAVGDALAVGDELVAQ